MTVIKRIPKKKTYGTSYHGDTLMASAEEISRVLGDPKGPSTDGKVQREWYGETEDGVVFTVYDYREGRPIPEDAEYPYHIGAFSSEDSTRAREVLEQLLG